MNTVTYCKWNIVFSGAKTYAIQDNPVYGTSPTRIETVTTRPRRRRTGVYLVIGIFVLLAVALVVGLVVWSQTRPRPGAGPSVDPGGKSAVNMTESINYTLTVMRP